jgi:hypothetical protein
MFYVYGFMGSSALSGIALQGFFWKAQFVIFAHFRF